MLPALLLRSGLFAGGLILLGHVPTTLASTRPADPPAIQDGLTPIFVVPFPRSLLLLDVLEGTRRAEPRARRADHPEQWDGAPAFDPEESAALLARLLDGSQREVRLLQEMRGLAADRLGLGGPPRTWRDSPPETSEVAQFRLRLQALERLVRTTRFQGHALLTGATPVLFLVQPPPSGALQRVTTFDLSTREHGLDSLDIAGEAEAAQALDLIDTALVHVSAARGSYLLDRREFEEGPPEGGLRTVAMLLERLGEVALLAADRRMGYDDRLLLDARFQSDLSRLDALSARTRFEDIPLLRGGLVLLQGAGSFSTILPFRLPETGADALGIATDVAQVDDALAALQLVDAARANVSALVRAVEQARHQLHRSGPRGR